MLHTLSTIALGPLFLAQGRYVRARTPKLPEPPGARIGTAGSGPPLRLLIAGDSAAAGVGAASQSEALLGQLVERLTPSFRVAWRLEAETGATTEDTLARLSGLGDARFDVLVTSLGVNDVTSNVGAEAWRGRQKRLRAMARERFGISVLVIAGVPPLEGFPALPQPLRWYLGARARTLSCLLRRDLETEPSAHYLDLRFTEDASLMAADGFHPGPGIYAEWATRAAAVIARSAL
jgi:lysophospholipase L1-like esterase